MWLFSNKNNCRFKNNYYSHCKDFTFISNDKSFILDEKKDFWFYEGYIQFRNTENINSKSSLETRFDELFKKYSDNFISYLKGNFILIRINKNSFTIYSDRFAIKKFFIWHENNEWIISNDLKEISKLVQLKPSKCRMALYSLTYHFTGGTTLFKNIFHNTPGQFITFKDNTIKYGNYWHPEQLLNISKHKVEIDAIVNQLQNTVNSFLGMVNGNICLSLTGGADTRNLLSIFLNQKKYPHIYTYGNPASNDCIKAAAIAKGLGLEHVIHDIQMDTDLFEKNAQRIIRLSGGLASIHRAHRLLAVDKESEYAEFMFLGTLGGEFIKGVSEDNYIVPSLVYENWQNNNFSKEELNAYLLQKKLNPDNIDINSLFNFIVNEPYMRGSVTKRKHNVLSFITAHLHDAQDINLYKTIMKEVYTPYLDIDYLETVFSSIFTFDTKESIRNNYIKRINNPVYSSKFLGKTFKPLLKYKYSGEHKPSEVLFNKYYAALIKSIRQKLNPIYPPNFSLGEWMEKFVKKHLPLCADYDAINKTFNIAGLIDELNNSRYVPKESFWLKYTNPIMMKFIIDEFKQ